MITLMVLAVIICVVGIVACLLPVMALPLLDIVVGGLIIYEFVKLIKKLRKKKDKD